MKSMTGYGEASQNVDGAKIVVQVRSLNHRHLDLQLRVPREYLALEEEMRKAIRERISRGRIDLFVSRAAAKGRARRLEMDESLLGQYLAFLRQAKKKFRLSGEMGIALLATIPDLFQVREIEADAVGERGALFRALGSALKRLEASRAREGRQLKKDMQAQIGQLQRIAGALRAHAAEIGVRIQKNLTAVKNGEADARAEGAPPELANVVLKGDINEEVVRLETHIATLGRVVRETQSVGKKLDFILQEVQRELNTISSKVPQLPVVQLVLEGKERVEKIREQSQNIE